MRGKENKDSRATTWYCSGGHNVFDSTSYSVETPPECGSCGMVMTTDSSSYDDVHQLIEDVGIQEISESDSASRKTT